MSVWVRAGHNTQLEMGRGLMMEIVSQFIIHNVNTHLELGMEKIDEIPIICPQITLGR